MQKIIDFILRYKELFTFALLVLVSFNLILNGEVSKIGGFRTFVIGTMGNIQETFAWIPNPGSLKSENRALRELNRELSTEVIRMRQAIIENERLRELLEFKEAADSKVLLADVVGRTVVELRNYITIDRGKSDSVAFGMPVRTDAGLVGSVMAVTENFSLVETLNNRNVRISAKVERTDANGILSWDGENALLLNNIPATFDVQEGDIVLTSNFSNKYPENLPIGVVTEVTDDKTTLFLKIKIRPFARFESLEQVFVVLDLPDPERIELIEKVNEQLKLLKKGN